MGSLSSAMIVELWVDSAVRSLLVAAAAGLLLVVLRIRDANIRHRTWSVVLGAMMALPMLCSLLPDIESPVWVPAIGTTETVRVSAQRSNDLVAQPIVAMDVPKSAPLSEIVERTTSPTQNEEPATVPIVRDPPPWTTIAVAVYVAIVAVLLVRVLIGVVLTRRMVRQGRRLTSVDHIAFVGDLPIIESSAVHTPATVGIWRPVILLPSDWKKWNSETLQLAIAHESFHVRRRDALVALAANVNVALNWLNPLSWFLRWRLTDLAERVCDDEVLRLQGDHAGYAETLLAMASRLTNGERVSPLVVPMARKAQVESRIEAIIDDARPLCRRLGWRGAVVILLVALPLIVVAAAVQQAQTAEASDEQGTPQSANFRDGDIIIRGKVINEDGKAIANAMLLLPMQIHPNPWTAEAKSDNDGQFELRVPADKAAPGELLRDGTIWCFHPNYGLTNVSAFRYLEGDVDEPIVIVPPAASETPFEVVGPDGQSVPGAMVVPWHFHEGFGNQGRVPEPIRELMAARTNAEGIANLRASYREGLGSIRVTAPGFGVQILKLWQQKEPAATKRIALRAAGRIEGQLVCEDPTLVAGVMMGFEQVEPRSGSALGEVLVTTDSKGRFVVPEFAEGSTRIVVLTKPNDALLPRVPKEVNVVADETTRIDIPYEPAVHATGRVQTDDTGEGVADAFVSIQFGGWHQSALVRTDSDGRFTASVLPGKVRQQLIVRPKRYRTWIPRDAMWLHSVTVSEGARESELPPMKLLPTTPRTGLLRDSDGQPLGDTLVMAVADNNTYSTATSNTSGEFELHWPEGIKIREFQVHSDEDTFVATVVTDSPLVLQVAGDVGAAEVEGDEQRETAKDFNAEAAEVAKDAESPLFPTLEEQRAADLAYNLLGVELEKLTPEDLERVRAKGYKGGLRVYDTIQLATNQMARADAWRPGDLLVGLHVWPTESLEQVQTILNRNDLDQLSPLKFTAIRAPRERDDNTERDDFTITGRVDVDLDSWRAMHDADKPSVRTNGAVWTPRKGAVSPQQTSSGGDLLYDGKTFDEWCQQLQFELKPTKRIDCIDALVAFGRAGKGDAAADALVALAGEFDWNRRGDPVQEHCLRAFYSLSPQVGIEAVLEAADSEDEQIVQFAELVALIIGSNTHPENRAQLKEKFPTLEFSASRRPGYGGMDGIIQDIDPSKPAARPNSPRPSRSNTLSVSIVSVNEKPITGSRNTYRVFLENSSSVATEHAELSVTFPPEIVPDMAAVKSPVEAQLVGNEVKFHPIALMRSGERINFQITANVLKAGEGEIVAKAESKDSPEKVVRQAVTVVDK